MKKVSIYLAVTVLGVILAFKLQGQTWNNVGSAGFTPGAVNYSGLDFDGTTPYFAFGDGSATNKVSVMSFDGSAWNLVGPAGFSAGQGNYVSLSMDGADPVVAYRDGGNSNKATVMKWDGTAWSAVGTAGFTTSSVSFMNLVVYSGVPQIAFQDAANANKASAMIYSGSAWAYNGNAGFSPGAAAFVALAQSGPTPYVAFQDQANAGKISVMTLSGPIWTDVGTPGFSAGVASHIDIWIDNGTPYVAYSDASLSSGLVVKVFDGTDWNDVGASPISAGGVQNVCIISNNDEPIVAYRDLANSNKVSVQKYAGGTWNYIGTAGFSAGSSNFISLVENSSGDLYVGFLDGNASSKGTVMTFTNCAPDGSSDSETICDGDSAFLQNDYQTAAGVYYDTLTNILGCDSVITTTLIVNPSPVAYTGGDIITLCTGSSVTLGTTSIGGHSYSWAPPTGLNFTNISNPVATPTVTSTYTLTEVILVTGCNKSNTVSLVLNPVPSPFAGADMTLCAADSVNLGTAAVMGHSYAWSPTAGLSSPSISNPKASPAASGIYVLTQTINFTGCQKKDTVNLIVNPLPLAETGPDTGYCVGGSVPIGAVTIPGHTYSWNPPSNLSNSTISNPTASPAATTTYTLTETITTTGCDFANSVLVQVSPVPPTPIINQPTAGTLHSNAPTGNQWFKNDTLLPGETNQDYTYSSNGIYKSVVTVGNCASDSSSGYSVTNFGVWVNSLLSGNSISVFPNPTRDGVFVTIDGEGVVESFRILNLLGICIRNFSNLQTGQFISFAELSNGIYFFEIKTGDQLLTGEIIKLD